MSDLHLLIIIISYNSSFLQGAQDDINGFSYHLILIITTNEVLWAGRLIGPNYSIGFLVPALPREYPNGI